MPAPSQNLVGPRLSALRRGKGMTQAMLAARCGLLGWDIGENTITKIETQIRCLVDWEVLCLAKALDVQVNDLFRMPNAMTDDAFRRHFTELKSRLDL
jgi:DNA-binding XRE family transcriptional regulator